MHNEGNWYASEGLAYKLTRSTFSVRVAGVTGLTLTPAFYTSTIETAANSKAGI